MYCKRIVKTNFLANNYSFTTTISKLFLKKVIMQIRIKKIIKSIQTFAANYNTLYLQLVA